MDTGVTRIFVNDTKRELTTFPTENRAKNLQKTVSTQTSTQRFGLFHKLLAILHLRGSDDAREDAHDIALVKASKEDKFETLDSVLTEIEAERELPGSAK